MGNPLSYCFQRNDDPLKDKKNSNQSQQKTNHYDLKKLDLNPNDAEKRSSSNSKDEQIQFGLPNMGNACYFNSMVQMITHCSNSTKYWPNNNQKVLSQLIMMKLAHENKKLIKELNYELFQMLPFQNKEVSHQTGNDPIRVFSSLIVNTKVEGNTIHIKYPPKKLKKEYSYWVEDNSQIEFLFSSVRIAGIQCDNCENFEVLDESRNFFINISIFQEGVSIQDSLQKVDESNNQNYQEIESRNKPIKSCSSCGSQRKFIKGFLKLPQFLVINLDQQIDVKQMEIEDNLKLYDSAREKNVEYNLIGFISHPTFHYTYFRRENKNSQQWTHFNDNRISTVTSRPNQQKAKILLYQANKKTRDPNIEFSLETQKQSA